MCICLTTLPLHVHVHVYFLGHILTSASPGPPAGLEGLEDAAGAAGPISITCPSATTGEQQLCDSFLCIIYMPDRLTVRPKETHVQAIVVLLLFTVE